MEQPSLGKRSFAGVAWTLGFQSIGFAAQLATLVALGRILGESGMGVVALVTTFVNLTVLTGGAGLARALVQRERIDARCEESAFWGALGWALLVWGGYALLAAPAAAFFREPALRGLIVASGALAVPAAIWPLAAVRLERRLRFREIGAAELFGFALPQAVVSIGAALAGAGAWSVVYGALVGRVLQTAILWRFSGWRPSAALCVATLRRLLGFGLRSTGAALAAFAISCVDYVIAGRMLGAAALGVYAVAYQLAAVPRSRIVQAVSLVAFPSLSRLQDDPARLGRAYVRMNIWVGYAVFPLLAGMFVLAAPLLEVAFGEAWKDGAPCLRILCPAGALMASRATVGAALNAVGRPGIGLASNLVVLVVSAPALYFGAAAGIEGLAFAVLAIAVINYVPLQLVLAHLVALDLGQLARGLARPASLSVATAFVTAALVGAVDGPLAQLLAGSAAFGGVYAALVAVFGRRFLDDARRLVGVS